MENTAALSAKHQYKTCGFCVPLGHVKPLVSQLDDASSQTVL